MKVLIKTGELLNTNLYGNLLMMNNKLYKLFLMLIFAISQVFFVSAFAESEIYPSKMIRLIVPFPPGGGADISGRIMAQHLSRELKVKVIVENKPGAGGNIGAFYVSKARSDGYTLLVSTLGPSVTNKIIYPKAGFDPELDLIPVALFSRTPMALVVNKSSPFNSVQDLVNTSKNSDAGLVYGSGGRGSTSHLGIELLKEMTGMKLTHIPYKGSAPALIDLIGGRLDFTLDSLPSVTPHIHSGNIKILAVAEKWRLKDLPDVPVLSEIPDLYNYEASGWVGLFSPKNTPPEVISAIARALTQPVDKVWIKDKLENIGALYVGADTQEFKVFLNNEIKKWTPLSEKNISK
uniref:Tripartite tricarboxylate transporter substrate binding protein n=1 Tax=Enterobacter cloacae TaxID=550 RepID=A0A4P8GKF5_ENTCL|nr:tripartite tricarboxylate transporter substrate binding protein [Enterobacter cloacae]QCO95802.1 hypothetical protein [Enterobacter cloacae]